jgi:hypothetical protein
VNARPLIGFIVATAVWWFAFLAVGIGFGLVWPAYRLAARFMFQESDLSHFTTPMLLVNYVVFLIAGVLVGALATGIGRSRIPALLVALVYLIYATWNHYFAIWGQLPDWYNLVVPWVITLSIILGSRIVRLPAKQAQRAPAG